MLARILPVKAFERQGELNMETSEFIDQNEAARLLNRKPRTLEYWRNARTGPPFQRIFGRRVRYRRADVLSWGKQWEVQPDTSKEAA